MKKVSRTRIANAHELVQNVKKNWNEKRQGRLSQLRVAEILGVSSATVSRNWQNEPKKQPIYKKQLPMPKVPIQQDLFKPKAEPISTYKVDGVVVKEYEDVESLIVQLGDSIRKTKELKAKLKAIF